MPRSTKRNVKTTQISTNEIREVFNSDSSSRPIPEKSRKASDFFVDGSVENSIYNNFIDEDYCPADEGETKKDKFTRHPFKWSHWRNYGGNENGGSVEGLPEIYWKNVIDFSGTEALPPTPEIMESFRENNLYRGIILAPPITEENVAQYINEPLANQMGLPTVESSIAYRTTSDNFEEYMRLNTKVGVDYSNDYSGGEPVFKIKVTPYLGHILPTYNDLGPITLPTTFDWSTLVILTGMLPATKGPEIKGLLDYFLGPKTPVPYSLTTVTQAATFLYAALATILIADAIWDWALKSPAVDTTTFQYNNLVKDVYNFIDIKDSKFKFGFGNKNFGYDDNLNGSNLLGSFLEKITLDGKEYEYSLSDYNYEGTPFSETNLINEFPTNTSTREKFLNMTFYPEGIQYDLDTPPPAVNYLVELIPVQNCKLSTTKPTAFLVSTPVHRYKQPAFNVTTPIIDTSITNDPTIPVAYEHTPITFVNAKFADFIGLLDQENDDPDSIFSLFGNYAHFCINTNGAIKTGKSNFSRFYANKYQPFSSNNLTMLASDIFEETPSSGVASSNYKVHFYREYMPQMLRNPYFRIQGSNSPSDLEEGLKILWQHSDDWEIRNGAIYRDVAGLSGSYLAQVVNRIGGAFYFLTIDYVCSAGSFSIDSNGFNNALYIWYGDYYWKSILPSELPEEDYPEGIFKGSSNITFSGSGVHKVLLKGSGLNWDTFKIIPSNNFVGKINSVKLQYLPIKDFTDPSSGRGAVSMISSLHPRFDGFPLYYQSDQLVNRELVIDIQQRDKPVDITITFPEKFYIGGEIIWGDDSEGNAITEEIDVSSGGIVTISRTNLLDLYANNSQSQSFKDKYYPIPRGTYLITINITSLAPSASSFTCNTNIEKFYDTHGLLVGADIDVKDSSCYYEFRLLPFEIKSLDISSTPSIDDTENLANNGSITESINLTQSNIYGSFDNLIQIPEIISVYSDVNTYSGNTQPVSQPLNNYNIVWRNSGNALKSSIGVEDLNRLLIALDFSSAENGTLDIAGNNPEITNTYALEAIDSLVSKGWNVLYNAKTIPVITLVGDNPLTWTLGETFVDPGATAYDERDGDITESIVVTDNIDVNTEGTYQVTYNVTDSDGNSAEEVVREVVVEESLFEEVTIGTQTWKVKNLDIDDGGDGIYAYNNDEANVATYGRLYTWEAAVRVANSVDGWRLPSDAEWTTLTDYLGGFVAGGKLKEAGTTNWVSPNTGATNETGFTALPGGGCDNYGSFFYFGNYGLWWSATEDSASSAWVRYMSYDSSFVVGGSNNKEMGFSVRLIKNYSHTPTITLLGDSSVTISFGTTYTDAGATAYDTRYGDITSDIVVVNNVNTFVAGTYIVTYNITTEDGNSAEEVVREVIVEELSLEEVTIGTQTWMAANLDIDDGLGGIFAYNNDETKVDAYGRLYTWDAAMRVAASIDGWHLPTDAEWTTLTTYLGGTSVAGGKLKETGTTHWRSPNTGATNESGFTALPVGSCSNNGGAFVGIRNIGYWWSTAEYDVTGAWCRKMSYNESSVDRPIGTKEAGFSVRLIRD